ncbi:MAG: PIN domain-containing protein [candidate division KSB1 bacterium]|nr:PIN domain-containing protein [candidate division KSB1 bacterium]MDZ7302694.1 PIN domain-containing protein [candidate division KSB1 bacterium]MDZ7311775.1 PIN domain-containing protein [candidate division KSB1 bacterium]
MRNSIFVDTGAWKALYDKDDPFHKIAKNTLNNFKRKRSHLITSNFILDETITLLRIRVSHESAVEFGEALRASRVITIIHVDEAIENEAWAIFKKYDDKAFSFTDCTSFSIMKRLAIERAFALDDHFRQFGLISVPSQTEVQKILGGRPHPKS